MVLLTTDHLSQYGSSDARLARVFFDGVQRTKRSALLIEIEPLFKARTFRELMSTAYEVKGRLEKDVLFEQVALLIDVDKSSNPIDQGYEITFIGKEPTLSKGTMGFDFNNKGEGSLRMSGEGLNIFGSGESVLAEVSKGSQSSTSLRFGFIKPLLKWRDAHLGLHLYRNSSHYLSSGFANVDKCVEVELTHEPVKNFIQHQLKYVANWRHVSLFGNWVYSTPFSIRQYAGPSLKSSVQSTLTLDTRNDTLLATRGFLLRECNELAGANGLLGGDVNFTRHEAHGQLATTLPLGLTFALGAKATYVRPLGLPGAPERSSLNVVDRTFLGGPCDLRGFEHNRVGPSDDGYYLGGCASWCAAAHIYKRLWPSFMLAHVFTVAGNVAPVDSIGHDEQPLRAVAGTLYTKPRLTFGLGLVVNLSRMITAIQVLPVNFKMRSGMGEYFR